MKMWKKNSVLLSCSMLFALLLVEGILQLFWLEPPQTARYFWPPNLKKTLYPNSEVQPGIYGESHFQTNSVGFRSDEIPLEEHLNIVAIGGSTTECYYLDQTETWTDLLQNQLTDNLAKKVWVGNMGKSGLHAGHHVQQLQYLIEDHTVDQPDLLIVLVGINDLTFFLSDSALYLNDTDQRLRERVFAVAPLENLPFYKETAIWQLLRNVKNKLLYSKVALDDGGLSYNRWRDNRSRASALIDALPKLDAGLQHYRTYLQRFSTLAKDAEIPVVFMTQPSLWKAEMEEREQALLWMGGIGKYQLACCHDYYTSKVLDEALQAFNHELLVLAETEKNISVLRLDTLLEKSTKTFIDDCHFNEQGAKQVAKFLGDYLMDKQGSPINLHDLEY